MMGGGMMNAGGMMGGGMMGGMAQMQPQMQPQMQMAQVLGGGGEQRSCHPQGSRE